MTKIVYVSGGPNRIKAGVAGTFEKGVPREVNDKLADSLIKKTSLKFERVKKEKRD